jgi:potassium-transporting ATPase KdpC subunit
MNDPLPAPPEGEVRELSTLLCGLRAQIRPALLSIVLLTLLTGVAFPLVLAMLALPLFSHQANGSLITRDGEVVGAELLGQTFSGVEYFQPRPSAAGDGYDATASGGTNLGPANPKLREGVKGDPAGSEKSKPFAGLRELAETYRRRNGLPADAEVPIDAVTRSGSGLDPHISPANAALQIRRVARARELSEEAVRHLVAEHTQRPQLGFLGEPRVAVLPLNLALDQLSPRSSSLAR